MNRLTRDEILHRALDLADSPALDAKDRPNGAIEPTALSLTYLQDGLDAFHHEFPWQGVVRRATIELTTVGQATLPGDFMLDVKDGIIVVLNQTPRRLYRLGLAEILDAQVAQAGPGDPSVYCRTADVLLVHPCPRASVLATLWYYALPKVLEPNTVPAFPTDWLLVEYVHLRAKEWTRMVPPGTARTFADGEIARLRRAGLGGEPESMRIRFDPLSFRRGGGDRTSWMGRTTAE